MKIKKDKQRSTSNTNATKNRRSTTVLTLYVILHRKSAKQVDYVLKATFDQIPVVATLQKNTHQTKDRITPTVTKN